MHQPFFCATWLRHCIALDGITLFKLRWLQALASSRGDVAETEISLTAVHACTGVGLLFLVFCCVLV